MNLRAALLQRSSIYDEVRSDALELSTGLSLLNLLLTGDTRTGVETGSVVWLSGQSDSGRTTLGLTMMAEAFSNPFFKGYDLFYDDAEGQRVEIGQYFGKRFEKKVQVVRSVTNTEFWDSISQREHPFIYFLDSLDGLGEDEAWRVNNDKANTVFEQIRSRNSLLIIASQEKRAGAKRINAGGFAVQFYSDYCLTTVNGGTLVKRVSGKERVVGTNTTITVKKCKRGCRKIVHIPAPIILMNGYNDMESILMYLWRKGIITEEKGTFTFDALGLSGKRGVFLKGMQERYEDLRLWLIDHSKEIL